MDDIFLARIVMSDQTDPCLSRSLTCRGAVKSAFSSVRSRNEEHERAQRKKNRKGIFRGAMTRIIVVVDCMSKKFPKNVLFRDIILQPKNDLKRVLVKRK